MLGREAQAALHYRLSWLYCTVLYLAFKGRVIPQLVFRFLSSEDLDAHAFRLTLIGSLLKEERMVGHVLTPAFSVRLCNVVLYVVVAASLIAKFLEVQREPGFKVRPDRTENRDCIIGGQEEGKFNTIYRIQESVMIMRSLLGVFFIPTPAVRRNESTCNRPSVSEETRRRLVDVRRKGCRN